MRKQNTNSRPAAIGHSPKTGARNLTPPSREPDAGEQAKTRSPRSAKKSAPASGTPTAEPAKAKSSLQAAIDVAPASRPGAGLGLKRRSPVYDDSSGEPVLVGYQEWHERPDAFGSEPIRELRDLGHRRQFCIRMQSRIDRALQSYVAMSLGAGGLPKGERQKVYKRASILQAIVAHELDEQPVKSAELRETLTVAEANALRSEYALILLSEQSRAPWDAARKSAQDDIRRIARTLPAWPWVESVPGASDLTLGIIVAEAGDPTAYRDKNTLCKRLGIGVVDGARQGSPGTGAHAEDWVRHGYNRERRSHVHVFLGDVLIRAQWRKQVGAIGSYGRIYGERKAYELARDIALGHADKRARRYASKCFIRDLRNAWRAANHVSPVDAPANGRTPLATPPETAGQLVDA